MPFLGRNFSFGRPKTNLSETPLKKVLPFPLSLLPSKISPKTFQGWATRPPLVTPLMRFNQSEDTNLCTSYINTATMLVWNEMHALALALICWQNVCIEFLRIWISLNLRFYQNKQTNKPTSRTLLLKSNISFIVTSIILNSRCFTQPWSLTLKISFRQCTSPHQNDRRFSCDIISSRFCKSLHFRPSCWFPLRMVRYRKTQENVPKLLIKFIPQYQNYIEWQE